MSDARIMREADGVFPNVLAIGSAFAGHATGILLLTLDSFGSSLLGFALLTAALCVAAYLTHECAHSTLFRKASHNALLGELLGWVTGACYAPFEGIRRKHLRHHADRVDNVTFDYRAFLARHPHAYELMRWLEWLYVPAIDWLMHGYVIVAPFVDERFARNRRRVLVMLAVRASLFGGLLIYSPAAFLLYGFAYTLFLHALRFIDMSQHLYGLVVIVGDEVIPDRGSRSKAYEDAHTYSNPFPARFRWLDLLTLNFVYHNAHHADPSVPWYGLPKLHRALYGEGSDRVLPLRSLLVNYHRGRVGRILYRWSDAETRHFAEPRHIPGAHGLSFLTQL